MMKEVTQGLDSLEYLLGFYNSSSADNLLDRMLYTDVMTYLPDDLLPKVDRPTMANGLEGRSPFLDHKLVEYAARMPTHLKISGFTFGTSRHIQRVIAKDLLPRQIIHREKVGFWVPVGNWFRNELKELANDTLLSQAFQRRGYFNMNFVRRMIDDHQSRQVDHTFRLWALLILELWHRQYMDQQAERW